MKQIATLKTGLEIGNAGSVEYSMPYGHGLPCYSKLNDLQANGWSIVTTSIVPGWLGGHGYTDTKIIFVLERPATAGDSNGV